MTKPLTPAERVLQINVSPMFTAILDFVLENPAPRVSPRITALAITSDGFLMGWNTHRPHKEGMLGCASSLEQNILGVCGAAGLQPDEVAEVRAAVKAKIKDWRS